MAVEFPPINICCLGTYRVSLRVCDHLLHEYSLDLLNSARFLPNILLSRSVRNMDIWPETPMEMPHPINLKRAFGLTVVISVTRVRPRLFPMFGPFTFRITFGTTLSASPPPNSALSILSIFASEHVYNCVLESLRDSQADAAAKFYRMFLIQHFSW